MDERKYFERVVNFAGLLVSILSGINSLFIDKAGRNPEARESFDECWHYSCEEKRDEQIVVSFKLDNLLRNDLEEISHLSIGCRDRATRVFTR